MEDFIEYLKKTFKDKVFSTSDVIALAKNDNSLGKTDAIKKRIQRAIEKNIIYTKKTKFRFKFGQLLCLEFRGLNEKAFEYVRTNLHDFNLAVSIIQSQHYINKFDFYKIFAIRKNQKDQYISKMLLIKDFLSIKEDDDFIYDSSFEPGMHVSNFDKLKFKYLYLYLSKKLNENYISGFKLNYRSINYQPNPLFNYNFDSYTNYNILMYLKTYFIYDVQICDSIGYTIFEAESFLKRINYTRKIINKQQNFIPVILAKSPSDNLISYCKQNGLIVIDLFNSIGEIKREYIQNLISIDDGDLSVNELIKTIDNLKQGNLFKETKGPIFEFLCKKILETYLNVKVKRNYRLDSETSKNIAQYDLIFERSLTTIICECKAFDNPVAFGNPKARKPSKQSVSYFLKQIKKYIKCKKITPKLLYFSANGFYKTCKLDYIDEKYRIDAFGNKKYFYIDLNSIKEISGIKELTNIWQKYFLTID